MAKIKIASPLINVISSVYKSFKVSEANEKTGIRHWREEQDFVLKGTPAGYTNNTVTDLNDKPYQIMEYDLNVVERRDAAAPEKLSAYDFIECLAKTCSKFLSRGTIKIILTDEIKSDVIKAIKAGLIDQHTNLVTEQVAVVQQVQTVPLLDLEDDEILGMKDIRKAVAAKTKETEDKEKDIISKTLNG